MTILFTDVVGFTKICSQISPMQVVDMLNSMYTKFDNLTEKHRVYKVHTPVRFCGCPSKEWQKMANRTASESKEIQCCPMIALCWFERCVVPVSGGDDRRRLHGRVRGAHRHQVPRRLHRRDVVRHHRHHEETSRSLQSLRPPENQIRFVKCNLRCYSAAKLV